MPTPRPIFTTALALALLASFFAGGASAQESKPAQPPPAAPSADTARGIELFKRGDTDAAITSLRAATKKDKSDADAWHYLGLALVKQHKPKDARKAFETAARLRPDFVAALNGLAYALISQNHLDDARRAVEQSLKAEPQNAETHYLSGAIYVRSGSLDKALAEAEESARIDPSYSHALFLECETLVGMIAREISSATEETADARAARMKQTAARLDEATAALDKYAKLGARGEDVTSLTEQIQIMRAYSGVGGSSDLPRAIYPPKEVTTKAVVLKKPPPEYTERARLDVVTGQITVSLVLAADGTVKYIFPLNRLPDGLTEEAIRAARGIKFIPATKDGQPVSQYAKIQYNFNIY